MQLSYDLPFRRDGGGCSSSEAVYIFLGRAGRGRFGGGPGQGGYFEPEGIVIVVW